MDDRVEEALPEITSPNRNTVTFSNNTSDSAKATHVAGSSADQSFLTVIQQAGIGATSANKKSETVSHLDDIITNFVPKQVRKMCHNLWTSNECSSQYPPKLIPAAVDAFAAVVMVDVSGYSKLTAALAERGPIGAELLSKTMKGYLDQVIVDHGGDIVKFAGDAVIVYWKSNNAIHMTNTTEDIERGELVYKASLCCLTLLTKLGIYDINISDCTTKTLRIHLGIGAGLIADVVVGGFPGRWEHFIAGDGVNQLSQVLDLAKAGELALSHQALKWLVWVVDIRTLNLGDYDKRCIILTGLEKAERRVPAPSITDDTLKITSAQTEGIISLYKNFMDRTALFKLQADVNQSNLFQLDAGLSDLLDLTELRQITTIFIKIGSLQGVQRDDLLEQSQNAIQAVQIALHKCDGSLRQFHVDDKGAVILCFFGLPPLAHENDAKLGINAGIEIRDRFSTMFDQYSIGITTGVVSFGGVGAIGRAEYAVMGDAINMAARLMCHKEAKRGILCDEKTYNLCESEFEFETLGEATVKGKSSPIAIFRPIVAIPEADKHDEAKKGSIISTVIGREVEKLAIQECIDQLTNSPIVENLIFNAEGGLGLSTLANYSRSEAFKRALQMEQNNSFYIFRNLICDIINLLDMGTFGRSNQFRILNTNVAIANPPTTKIIPKDLSEEMVSAKSLSGAFPKQGNYHVKSPHGRPSVGLIDHLDISSEMAELHPSGLMRKQSYVIQESPIEITLNEELFTIKLRSVIEKLQYSDNQAAMLQLVTMIHADESDSISKAHLELHAKDLCDFLVQMLNILTKHNKIIVMVTESHYIDRLSWDLLLELAVACPRLAILSFGRPQSNFESKENRRICRLIEQLPRSKSISLGGLSSSETYDLIMATWSGHSITSVDPKISESIFKRTDGNPFFIRSLVISLKESGQWRVVSAGVLTTPDAKFDFDKLVLGYDNQSIVLSQFDKLDRNFQLFLKVASVLGHKFSLDDVLFFLTGVADASEVVERKKYTQIITGLYCTDKYSFLQKESIGPEGAFFQFKSALVRKCIYAMMANNQRQQIHLLVARYLERKINEQNKHRYVLQVLEHYTNTSAIHKLKLISYTEMAAHYFFEKDFHVETIKYCKKLLDLIGNCHPDELKELTNLQIANYHRELGYALTKKDVLDEAEIHLVQSLKLMGYALPHPGKMKAALNAQISIRTKLDKTFFKDRPVPQEEDYTQSYVAKKGASGYSLSNIVHQGDLIGQEQTDKESANLLPKFLGLSPTQQTIRNTRECQLNAVQHALVTLASVFLKKGNFSAHHYAILLGLNIWNENSQESHMTILFSLGALAWKYLEVRQASLPAQYMEAAISFDLRTDIHTSLQQVVSNATLLFLGGQLEACQNKLKVVDYLSTMAGDLNARLFGLNLLCVIQTHSISREAALVTAKELYNLSHQREMALGKMWGCFHIINNTLGEIGTEEEIQLKSRELVSTWTDFKQKFDANSLPCELAKETILMLIPLYLKKNQDYDTALEKIQGLIYKMSFHQWNCFAPMSELGLALIAGLNRGHFTNPELLKELDTLCATANHAIKSLKGLQMHDSLRRIFKGLKLALQKKNVAAFRAWNKGVDDHCEDNYVQAILHSSIVTTGQNQEKYLEMAEGYIRDLKAKSKFQVIFTE